MESKLEQLKTIVADMFEKAEDKMAIDSLSKINNMVDEAVKEQAELTKNHQELLNDYREVIKHTSFKPTSATEPKDPTGSMPITFEDALKQFVENN